jgi:hypothetical protein
VILLADVLARVRVELNDQPKAFNFMATGDGTTKTFNLTYKPIELSTVYVTVNNIPVAYPNGYSLDANNGIITFATAPAANTNISVTGNYDRYFLDADLTNFINTAVTQHTYNRVNEFGSQVTLNNLDPVEQYPLAILATIEALWALATDAAFDIDILAPDGISIPRSERYRQLSEMIQARWEQYRTLCAQLNIGLWRIEMGTLTRISRTTNKYVPIYMGQEIDDSRRPERVYITNNLTGRSALPSTVGVYDIELVQGNNFTQNFTFPFDISNLTFTAQMRTYPNSPSLYATFGTQIVDGPNGILELSLNPSDTEYLPVRAFWDVRATDSENPNFAQTYMMGQVFTTQAVTTDGAGNGGSW